MPLSKLGGFKVLRDVSVFSLVLPPGENPYPARVFEIISNQRINLPYVTCLCHESFRQILFTVSSEDQDTVTQLIKGDVPCQDFTGTPSVVILSLFPHRNDFEIAGSVLAAIEGQDFRVQSMATSPSTISLVIQKECFTGACLALSRALDFPSPSLPLEWRAAKEGKERLYKEVVASYQEKKPKVYGLEIQEGLDLCFIALNQGRLKLMARSFRKLAGCGVSLSFMSSLPCPEMRGQRAVLCLPAMLRDRTQPLLFDAIGNAAFRGINNACLFTMSGPHFGDRYGLVTKLFKAFQQHRVDLLALNCTVASITGIVAEQQLDRAIRAIQSHFHVPEITLHKL